MREHETGSYENYEMCAERTRISRRNFVRTDARARTKLREIVASIYAGAMVNSFDVLGAREIYAFSFSFSIARPSSHLLDLARTF